MQRDNDGIFEADQPPALDAGMNANHIREYCPDVDGTVIVTSQSDL